MRKFERWWRWVGGLILCGAVLQAQAQPLKAPSITFTTLDGHPLRLQDLRGKIVLVNFWATSCGVCLAEMPALIRTYQHYHPQGLEIIAVAVSYDQPERIRAYVKQHALSFPVVWDTTGDIGRRFPDVQATPTTFIIDKRGQLISRTLGAIDVERLQLFLQDELN